MPVGATKGNKRRLGKTLPQLTCVNCGKTKSCSAFPKRGGPTYEDVPPIDPRRYDSQCKLCKKAVPEGKDRSTLKEPKRYRSPDKKVLARKKKKKVRRNARTLTRAEYKQKVRFETRIKSMLYLAEHGCEECNERDPRKLEYDHKKPGDKKRAISRLIINGFSWSSPVLREEIRKCRVLCANCHRKHTVKQQGYYASPEVTATLTQISKDHGFDL